MINLWNWFKGFMEKHGHLLISYLVLYSIIELMCISALQNMVQVQQEEINKLKEDKEVIQVTEETKNKIFIPIDLDESGYLITSKSSDGEYVYLRDSGIVYIKIWSPRSGTNYILFMTGEGYMLRYDSGTKSCSEVMQ